MSDKLNKYNKKRDFNKTDEPEGVKKAIQNSEPNSVFVVQHHIAGRDHYDLRLEYKGVLLSWAVPKGLSYNPNDKRLAIQVEDHPFEYRNFEGTIPKGEYGGGTVMIWDEGFWLGETDTDSALAKGELKFALLGKRLMGAWVLVKVKGDGQNNNWLLIKEKDKYAKDENGIADFTTSIKTGRTMEEIAEGQCVQ